MSEYVDVDLSPPFYPFLSILNKIINGDCLEVMKEIPARSIEMILCDLPYGLTNCKWDSIIPLDKLWEQYLRIIKPNGVIALTASQPFTSILVCSQLPLFKHEWIWIKNQGSNFANTVREPMKEHESVLIFSMGKWTYNKQMQERTGGGLSRTKYDVNLSTKTENYGSFPGLEKQKLSNLRVPSSHQKFNTEKGFHPTQKPVDLFRYLIRTYTNKGDVVLDNCIGSGTTAIAAIRENRAFIGIEIENKFVKISNDRIGDEIDFCELLKRGKT